MRILFGLHQFFPMYHTGTERFTLDLARQVQRMGHYVTVLTYEPRGSDALAAYEKYTRVDLEQVSDTLLRGEYVVGSVPVISLAHRDPVAGFSIFDQDLHPHLVKIVSGFDLVHLTHPMRFSECARICKDLAKPLVLTVTDSWLLCPRGLLTSDQKLCRGPNEGAKCKDLCGFGDEVVSRYWAAQSVYNAADAVVSGSNFLRHFFYENGWDRNVILNPFSVDYAYVDTKGSGEDNGGNESTVRKPGDRVVFSYIGTLAWHKGAHVLVEAFKQVKDEGVLLKIYGNGERNDPYVRHLHGLAESDERIEFCGTFDYGELPRIMEEISCVVIPSRYMENYPLVMQMGLAYKKPVIASNIGGMPEVIRDRFNGYLFEIGNVGALSDILSSIAEDPLQLDQIARNITPPPRIESEAFNYEKIYRRLHAGRRE